jgi:hypothetical protein
VTAYIPRWVIVAALVFMLASVLVAVFVMFGHSGSTDSGVGPAVALLR